MAKMARPTGVEPVTLAFGGQYSIQLSYGRVFAGLYSNRAKPIHPALAAFKHGGIDNRPDMDYPAQ